MTIGERARQEQLERAAFDLRWREQRGWKGEGPSPLASPEEKRAYQALQVIPEIQAGRATVADLPEAYGGRPTGTSRRAIRMQAEWDKAQQTALENQRLMEQLEQAQRQEQMFQLDYASKQYDLRTKQNEDLFNLRKDADLKQAEAEFTEFRNKLNPNDPASVGMLYSYISSDPRLANSKVAYTSAEFFNKAAENSITSINNKAREEAQNKYVEDMQKLMETGVTEEELPQYYDPESPIGMPQFDPRKVAARVGGTKAQEKAEAKETKEETPKEKIGLDLQQAYGELNSALTRGEDTAAAQSKVAGLRARYEAATGEAAPEVFPKLKTREEYDRLPAGTAYIGKDGKKRIKQ